MKVLLDPKAKKYIEKNGQTAVTVDIDGCSS